MILQLLPLAVAGSGSADWHHRMQSYSVAQMRAVRLHPCDPAKAKMTAQDQTSTSENYSRLRVRRHLKVQVSSGSLSGSVQSRPMSILDFADLSAMHHEAVERHRLTLCTPLIDHSNHRTASSAHQKVVALSAKVVAAIAFVRIQPAAPGREGRATCACERPGAATETKTWTYAAAACMTDLAAEAELLPSSSETSRESCGSFDRALERLT